MSKKNKIALIYGGPSAEYDVSLNSATAIRSELNTNKYEIMDVHIGRDGSWKIDGQKLSQDTALDSLRSVDIAVLSVHGTFGEDGKLQELLSKNHINFTGSEATASSLAMEKDRAGKVFEDEGLAVPKTYTATSPDEAIKISQSMPTPFVIKPVSQGSSVGVSIVRDRLQIEGAIKLGFKHDQKIIIQEFIAGREVSCGVLETASDGVRALPPTELIPIRGDFFDYHSKYTPGATNEITPPAMSSEAIEKIQSAAIRAHKSTGCRDYSRTDMIVADDKIYVIEINTLPGMTETSILPQQAAAAGISFPNLIDLLIDTAAKRSGS